MKNNYLSQLQAAAFRGRQEGVLFGLDLCVIALNHQFGFGKERIERLETEEAIEEFLRTFKLGVKCPAKDFYEWHHILTGSCEFGRNAFVKNHGIDLEHDNYTVEEFIEITKNDFGSDVIGQLAERMKK